MKVSSINNISHNNSRISFKKTAVPYPEYNSSYSYDSQSDKMIYSLISKISELFHPDVTKEAANIKSKIDNIYEPKTVNPKDRLLSVLA